MIALLVLLPERKRSMARAKAKVEAPADGVNVPRKAYPKRKSESAVCQSCGELFPREPQQARNQVLCPTKCQPIRRRELNRERQQRFRAKGRTW